MTMIEEYKTMQQLKSEATLQSGKYRIEKVLGQGGFGITYMAMNVAFEEEVCIKEFFMKGINERDANATTISISNADSRDTFEEQRKKFKKEAQRLFALHNEHIVRVLDLFDENHTTYYVMELIKGENLAEVMKRTGQPLKENVALDYFRQVLNALQTAHNQKIWHLDIKPANIMVDTHHHVKLIDFGASKQINAEGSYTTVPTAMCYTKGYAPVEQVAQDYSKLGPWTDFYALGATLYRFVTNNEPPQTTTILNEGKDAFLFSLPISSNVQALIIWLMEPSISKRPKSADGIENYLNSINMLEENAESNSTTNNGSSEDTILFEGQLVENDKNSELWHHNSSLTDKQKSIIDNLVANMVLVKGGTFIMGGTMEQGNDIENDEKPVHQVTLSSFKIGRYEVTQEEWQAVMGHNPFSNRGSKYPVDCASWNDCHKFIVKLNQLTGKEFRLPTEAEWEFAARGGEKSKGYKYAGSDNIDEVAWFADSNTHPIGKKIANELGLYDMSGNILEWCQDWYGHYGTSSTINPMGPSKGNYHVARGGCWHFTARNCRISYRSYSLPDNFFGLGLRLVL